MPSTISVGYSSRCSSSVATGRICSSTNSRTTASSSRWSSVSPSVSCSRAIGDAAFVLAGTLRELLVSMPSGAERAQGCAL